MTGPYREGKTPFLQRFKNNDLVYKIDNSYSHSWRIVRVYGQEWHRRKDFDDVTEAWYCLRYIKVLPKLIVKEIFANDSELEFGGDDRLRKFSLKGLIKRLLTNGRYRRSR